MTTLDTAELMDLVRSDRANVDGPNALISAGLDGLTALIIRAMDELPKEYEAQMGGWETRVWLADLLIEAAQIERDRAAAMAEVSGIPVGRVAAALGQKTGGNGRAKARHWKQLAEAHRAANLTGHAVPVDLGRFRVVIDPMSSPRQADA